MNDNIFLGNYTGEELEDRLVQGTYLDAVKAGFEGTKKEFDEALSKIISSACTCSAIPLLEIEEIIQS